MENNTAKDFLGNPIEIGDGAVMCTSWGRCPKLQKVEILDIDNSRKDGRTVKIIAEGNLRPGWTYPERIMNVDL